MQSDPRIVEETKQKVALGLFTAGAIRFGAFRLKLHDSDPGAPPSPFYIDLRIVRSFPELMDAVTDLYVELLGDLRFELIADVPTASTPFAVLVSYKTRTPMITPRLGRKQHGVSSRIDGVYHAGQTAIVIDDLVTAGESKLEAIAVLREEGLLVNDVAVLIDRQQGGVEQLRSGGVSCHSVFRLRDLLCIYRDRQLISADQFSNVVTYLRSRDT